MRYVFRIVLAAAVAAGAAACSKSDTAQARSREATPKSVQTEAVRQDSVRRAVDVVGTLAAVDEVTISSEADGTVSKIFADLGDRVKTGQLLVQLDNEKQRYALRSSRRRWLERWRSTARRTRTISRNSKIRRTRGAQTPISFKPRKPTTAPANCSSEP